MKNFSLSFFCQLSVLSIGILTACNTDQKSGTSKTSETILAKASGETLYLSELTEILPKGLSQADSVAFVRRYAESWIRKKLLMDKAINETQDDVDDIDKKVADFKEYLILQAFQKQYVDKNVDSTVTEQEIKTYYQNNPENFALQQSIVKAKLIAVPKNTPGLDRVRGWMQSGKTNELKELRSFSFRFASFYHLEDSKWVIFEDLIRKTPIAEEQDRATFLKNTRFAETSDQQNVYLLAVKEFKLSSQPAPLDFVRPQIREILLNRRKVKLIQDLEKKVYEDGLKKKEFEIRVQ